MKAPAMVNMNLLEKTETAGAKPCDLETASEELKSCN